MAQKSYFHVCPILLAPQSVILPGNFGRIQHLYNANSVGALAYREKVLEDIRVAEFTAKPSRFRSCFLVETIEEAIAFRSIFNPFSEVYEVQIEASESPLHRGDWKKVAPPNVSPCFLTQMPVWARNYWSGVGIEHPEIVVESPIRILRKA